MRLLRAHWVRCVALGILLPTLVAACATTPPGSLLHQPQSPTLVRQAQHSLAVAPVLDARPKLEREGDTPHVSFFMTLIFFWWVEKRGNWISDDYLCSPHAAQELTQLAQDYLAQSGAFSQVSRDVEQADFVLESELLHLYGTYYEARRTMVAVSPQDSTYEQNSAKAAFGAYGNATLRVKLVDRRGPSPQVVWQRLVSGTAEMPPSEDNTRVVGEAARRAARRALQALTHHVSLAVLDYAPPAFDPATFQQKLQQKSQKETLEFVVARSSKHRSARELLTLAHPSGKITAHRVERNRVVPVGRPGDWLLARQRPDGTLMPYAEYDTLAHYLAQFFDLRRVDEMYHYHFFGAKAPPEMAPASPDDAASGDASQEGSPAQEERASSPTDSPTSGAPAQPVDIQ